MALQNVSSGLLEGFFCFVLFCFVFYILGSFQCQLLASLELLWTSFQYRAKIICQICGHLVFVFRPTMLLYYDPSVQCKRNRKIRTYVIQSSSSALENVLAECVASFFYREQKPVSLDCHMHTCLTYGILETDIEKICHCMCVSSIP